MKYSIGAVVLCGLLLLSPVSASAQTTESLSDSYQATLLQLIDALLQQIAELEAELERRQAAEAQTAEVVSVTQKREIVERDFLGGSARVEAQYLVEDEDSYKDIPYFNHRRYLRRVMDIIPDAYDERIGEFVVFDDGDGDYDAFVQTIPPTHDLWTFAVHEDILNDVASEANTELIVHEFAHILSYDSPTNSAAVGTKSCHSYFADGCPDRNAFLMLFVQEFWSSTELSRVERYRSVRNPLDEAFDYYDSIEDEEWFITDYASVSPEEDFAESFASYVMDRPIDDDTLAEQKVWWFDQYPELKTMRSEIRSND